MSTNVQRGWAGLLLAAGLILIGLNLRIGVASVSPVLSVIRDGLDMSATAASLLTTIPVFAFGIFAFLTPMLTRRLGTHRLLGLVVAVLAAGILLRLAPSLLALFAGTVLVGAAIAIGNVVMPAAIKRDFPQRAGLMMGLYSTSLYLGAAAASGLTSPLTTALGGSWRGALAVWAAPAALALVLWLPQLRHGAEAPARTGADADHGQHRMRFSQMLTDPIAIAVTVMMGLQSVSYYTLLTWVPTILQDHGMHADTAGLLLAFSSLPGIAGALVTPMAAGRLRPAWLPVAICAVLVGIAYAGLAFAPTAAALVWMTMLGLGQGAALSLALAFIVARSPDVHHTGQLSTMAQGFGYLIAGLGPIGISAVHAATGEWGVPFIVLAVLLVGQLVAGVIASRPVHVGERLRERAAEPTLTA